jgi:ATP-dependent helicase/nuclease subunit B
MENNMIKILIADDQELIRQSLLIILNSIEDFTVTDTAADGEEVIQSVKKERPDVILMDIRMPVMDGLEAAAAIRALERELYAMQLKPYDGPVNRVRLLGAATPFAEVHEAAARLRLLALEKGFDFADMAAIYPNEETYAPLIRAIFPLYEIPFTLHEKRPAAHHPLIRFLLSALRAVTRGYDARDVLDCARTMYAGLTQEECDLLENYVIRWEIRGGMWIRETDWTAHPD